MKRMLLLAPLAAVLAACADAPVATTTDPGNATPTAAPLYVDQYLGASSALDAATGEWRAGLSQLAASGTDYVAKEAPYDTAYAQGLATFQTTLRTIKFPSSLDPDVNTLIEVASAVQDDLTSFAAGTGSASQFVEDEKKLQSAINIVQTDLSLGTSTLPPD